MAIRAFGKLKRVIIFVPPGLFSQGAAFWALSHFIKGHHHPLNSDPLYDIAGDLAPARVIDPRGSRARMAGQVLSAVAMYS
jgi:hypothetical protein